MRPAEGAARCAAKAESNSGRSWRQGCDHAHRPRSCALPPLGRRTEGAWLSPDRPRQRIQQRLKERHSPTGTEAGAKRLSLGQMVA